MVFRRSEGETTRTVQEVCMEELSALAREIKDSGQMGEAAVNSMAKEIGLQRLKSASRERLQKALEAVSGFAGKE